MTEPVEIYSHGRLFVEYDEGAGVCTVRIDPPGRDGATLCASMPLGEAARMGLQMAGWCTDEDDAMRRIWRFHHGDAGTGFYNTDGWRDARICELEDELTGVRAEKEYIEYEMNDMKRKLKELIGERER